MGILAGTSCSDKSDNLRITKSRLAASIKDTAGAIVYIRPRIGDINNTNPSDLETYQSYSRSLDRDILEAKRVGFTDAEIQDFIREGQVKGARALSELNQRQ